MSAKNVALCRALGYVARKERTGYWSMSLNGQCDNMAYFDETDAYKRGVPDYATDISAGLAALDATGKPYELRRSITRNCHYYKIYKDDYVDESSDNANGKGATQAEACFAALCAYYHVEVSSGD